MTDHDDIRSLEARVARLEAVLTQGINPLFRFGPIGDPGPWPGGWGGGGYRPPVFGPGVDPATVDYSRLPVAQLEVALHAVNAEKARLASIEAQVTQHLESAKKKT
jgi:hypothetical protein